MGSMGHQKGSFYFLNEWVIVHKILKKKILKKLKNVVKQIEVNRKLKSQKA